MYKKIITKSEKLSRIRVRIKKKIVYNFINNYLIMAYDREILREIWEGQIPVCFQADPEEISALQQPENFYLMISRLSYLPLVTDKVN